MMEIRLNQNVMGACNGVYSECDHPLCGHTESFLHEDKEQAIVWLREKGWHVNLFLDRHYCADHNKGYI